MLQNPIQTNPPKWLKTLLTGELIVAIIMSFFTLIAFIITYLPQDSNLEMASSFPIETGLMFLVISLIPWIIVSIYTKLIVKSWKPLMAKYKIAVLSLPILAFVLALGQSVLQFSNNLKVMDRSNNIVGDIKSILIDDFPEKWPLYLSLVFFAFVIYGLLYGLFALFSNYKKVTSIPWFNFIHLPGFIWFITIFLAQEPAYNSQNEASVFIAQQVLRIGFVAIPLAFTAFLFLEYRAINKRPVLE